MRLLTRDRAGVVLLKMGFIHGKDFDCMQVECRVCIPYRVKEREEWDNMSAVEQGKISWGVMS